MSILSATEKSSIDSVFDAMHDTFKRTIYMYVEEQQSVDLSDNNPLFGGGTPTVRTELVQYTGEARVKYINDQRDVPAGYSVDNDLIRSNGLVRLKVNSTDKELLKKASRIEVDDILWTLDGSPKPIGPFARNYFEVYLIREN